MSVIPAFLLLTMMVFLLLADFGESGVVLDKKIMTLAKVSAELSTLAYYEDPYEDPMADEHFRKKGAVIQSFIAEPDQAIFVKKDGYCFLSFRGTTLTTDDWRQNIRPGTEPICADDNVCCDTRQGFYDAYATQYSEAAEQKVRECAATCTNRDECVVLTGHSQGGAIAAVAAVRLADLNPYIITFGQPYTMDAPCSKISSERFYRFINSVGRSRGIVYDPIPFLPGLGADAFGYQIVLSSDDDTGVAYIGLDAQDYFGPLDLTASAHSMVGTTDAPGYLDRIKSLMNNHTYPIRDNGYVPGSLCSEGKECTTGVCEKETSFSWSRCVGTMCEEDKNCNEHTDRCDSGVCIPKLGTCMPCDEDSDCTGGKCTLFRCSGSNGLMDDECNCKSGKDCNSGRCEGIAPPLCYPKNPEGAWCNEDTDCISEECSWKFTCVQAGGESDSESKGGFLKIGLVVLGSATLLAAFVFAFRYYLNLRRGYEEIPATLLTV